jgi:hypothetical protein
MAASSFLRALSSAIRLASIVAVLFVVAGLIGFLTDEVRDSSEVSATRITFAQGTNQQVVVDITDPDPSPFVEKLREREHTSGREFIDDVNDVLLKPFTWIGQDRDVWVQRLICSGLALFCYGFLLQLLADRLRRLGDEARREAIGRAEQKAAEERKASGTFVSPA